MNKLFLFTLSVLLFTQCTQSPIYYDNNISIYNNKLIQKQYTVEAISGEYLISNYSETSTEENKWKLGSKINDFPEYNSSQTLVDALYNLSLDLLNKSNFSIHTNNYTTKAVSNSIIQSLAILKPDECKRNLLNRVKKHTILQDKGEGGSWPINTDRMLWTIAAWEVYKTSGDKGWLKKIYPIIKNSLDVDLNVVWDTNKQLFRGKSSSQTEQYASWMQSKDIFCSYSLNIQAIYYKSLQILVDIGTLLNKDVIKYKHLSSSIKNSINKHFWDTKEKRFANILYNNNILSEGRDILGESLCILFDIEKDNNIIKSTVSSNFGAYSSYPSINSDTNYIYAYIQAYHNWAAAKSKEQFFVQKGIASLIRTSALSLKNIEKYPHQENDFSLSKSELTGISANLSIIFRIIVGLNYKKDNITFTPFIPREYKGKRTIRNLKYINSNLDIEIIGFGDAIKTFSIDGVFQKTAQISSSLKGKHIVEIKMTNQFKHNNKSPIKDNIPSIDSPTLSLKKGILTWSTDSSTYKSKLYINAKDSLTIKNNIFTSIDSTKPTYYSVVNINKDKKRSLLSNTILVAPQSNKKIININNITINKTISPSYNFAIRATHTGVFVLKFKYSNGNGGVYTGNSCALRSMWKKKTYLGSIVFPHTGAWDNYMFTNEIKVNMRKGMNNFSLVLKKYNNNMNYKKNEAIISEIHILALDK